VISPLLANIMHYVFDLLLESTINRSEHHNLKGPKRGPFVSQRSVTALCMVLHRVAAQVRQQPVISVDTKKKELIGNFKNGGRPSIGRRPRE
jgi:hypothetical protein